MSVTKQMRLFQQPAKGKMLDYECKVFCRYLIGAEPDSYVLEKYRRAHERTRLSGALAEQPFDALLVKAATLSPLAAQWVDSYARVFCRDSLVRKKLVLLLAILESSASTYSSLDGVDSSSTFLLSLRLLGKTTVFGLMVLAGAIFFLPLQGVATAAKRLAPGGVER